MSKPPKHILVIRFSAMGDVAMTVPVIRALILKYPDIKITVLTREFFSPFFRDLPNVSVYVADLKGKHSGVFGLYKLSKDLKRSKIDAVADLHNVLRSKLLKLFLIGIKCIQIDKGRAEKKALVSGKIFEQLKSTHHRYADVFKGLGYPIDLSNPLFPGPKNLSNNSQQFFKETNRKKVGIAPFAQHESKMYPLDEMEKVIETLSKKYFIVLFGGGNKETQILNAFQQKLDNVISLASTLSLDEELDVISNLDVMISMDSGNAHIAAMLGKKVITLWGVTHPYAGFSPFNQPAEYALLANRNQFPLIPTSVYGNHYPKNYKEASRSISVVSVVEKLESII